MIGEYLNQGTCDLSPRCVSCGVFEDSEYNFSDFTMLQQGDSINI